MSSAFTWIKSKFWDSRLGWKLMASYFIVIVMGVITLAIVAEMVVPATFTRHVMEMEAIMGAGTDPARMAQLETDLYANYQSAFTEALTLAAIIAVTSAFLVSFLVSRRVVTPIRKLMHASQHIAAGYYDERVTVASDDELGQLAQSFNRMAETLYQTEELRRELIGNVTHELRTPLTSIKGYMEGLLDGVLPPTPNTFQQVYHEADRLQRLVNDLQELSRVEAGAFTMHRQFVAVGAVIQRIADRLHPQFEAKGVTLTLHVPETLPSVWADEDRLSQILVNLMGNALQYTPSGGTVTVSAAQKGDELHVTISDTGIGIPPEHLRHLFTRFYRVDKSRSRAGGGSGIGLTIARHLVEAHGGRIWVHSDGTGKGSTFGFSLPLRAV